MVWSANWLLSDVCSVRTFGHPISAGSKYRQSNEKYNNIQIGSVKSILLCCERVARHSVLYRPKWSESPRLAPTHNDIHQQRKHLLNDHRSRYNNRFSSVFLVVRNGMRLLLLSLGWGFWFDIFLFMNRCFFFTSKNFLRQFWFCAVVSSWCLWWPARDLVDGVFFLLSFRWRELGKSTMMCVIKRWSPVDFDVWKSGEVGCGRDRERKLGLVDDLLKALFVNKTLI